MSVKGPIIMQKKQRQKEERKARISLTLLSKDTWTYQPGGGATGAAGAGGGEGGVPVPGDLTAKSRVLNLDRRSKSPAMALFILHSYNGLPSFPQKKRKAI
jgi:hypothetical protein